MANLLDPFGVTSKLFKKPNSQLPPPDENVLAGMNYIDKTTGRSYKRVKGADGKYTTVEEYTNRGTPEEDALVEMGRDIQKDALEAIHKSITRNPASISEFSPYVQAYINLGKQNITDSYAAALQSQGNALGTRGLGGGGSYSQGAKAALDAEYGKALQANYWQSILAGSQLENQEFDRNSKAYGMAESIINPTNAANISASTAGIGQNNATLGLNTSIARAGREKNSPGEDLLRIGAAAGAGYLAGGPAGGAMGAANAAGAAQGSGSAQAQPVTNQPYVWTNPNTGQPAGTSGAFNQQQSQPWYHIW